MIFEVVVSIILAGFVYECGINIPALVIISLIAVLSGLYVLLAAVLLTAIASMTK